MTAPGQRRERGRHDRIRASRRSSDAARDKGRGVEFVVGEQHQTAAHQVGAALDPAARQRQAGDAPARRRRSPGDAGGKLAEDQPSGADHPGAGQIERRQIVVGELREANLAALDKPGGRCPICAARHRRKLLERRAGPALPQDRRHIFERRRSDKAIASSAAVIDPVVLDQADRRADDRRQRLGLGRARASAAPAAQRSTSSTRSGARGCREPPPSASGRG